MVNLRPKNDYVENIIESAYKKYRSKTTGKEKNAALNWLLILGWLKLNELEKQKHDHKQQAQIKEKQLLKAADFEDPTGVTID